MMSLETIKSCPVCEGNSFNKYLNVQDYTVSNKEFTIQQCTSCHFLLTNPRPPEDEIGAFYESTDYISHHDEARDLFSKVYIKVRDYTLRQKLKMLNSLFPDKGNLLDIGCGTGNFIHVCQKDGWHISGTEPDAGARKVAAGRAGAPIFDSINAPELQTKKFSIISLWHVLEHVHQLNETIAWLEKHLEDNGKIIIAVPNPQSADALTYGKYWAAYDVPRHLYHFTKASMRQLLNRHSLRIDQIKPMWFDSFYVSMLSTKYQKGKTDLLNSVKTGVLSNIKGNSNHSDSLNTSSLIYIISKQ
ncbi:hypothetical protein DYBT9275_04716 [Dyadobacter sp. CECT 9275]|uniref:Class I SAM-dependent methyltransferase n=1 Tax=Dyadobacter helix TaxID=2822344 RepID=A0A916JJE7_9BACT|nr:class I SAM-dependent methyltransferase [Dyadobacter sp. CECT 9275]CAG5010438.1 hypothetical protein DYBT9275_04716 [Dyadobacter sp. CECT 9275]